MDIVIRITLIYLVLLLALRLMGKREFGQLSPFELLTLLLIPEILSEALHPGDRSLTGAFVGVFTLLSLVFLTAVLAYRSPRIGEVTEGVATVLVQRGALVPSTLHRERVSPDEIFSEMHKAGLERLEQVKWAVLEPDGRISFVPWEQPLPARNPDPDMHIT